MFFRSVIITIVVNNIKYTSWCNYDAYLFTVCLSSSLSSFVVFFGCLLLLSLLLLSFFFSHHHIIIVLFFLFLLLVLSSSSLPNPIAFRADWCTVGQQHKYYLGTRLRIRQPCSRIRTEVPCAPCPDGPVSRLGIEAVAEQQLSSQLPRNLRLPLLVQNLHLFWKK